jgi:hypothetical protein
MELTVATQAVAYLILDQTPWKPIALPVMTANPKSLRRRAHYGQAQSRTTEDQLFQSILTMNEALRAALHLHIVQQGLEQPEQLWPRVAERRKRV